MTKISPALGGQKKTGREPGLPRLHQQRYEEMLITELSDLLNERQTRLISCEYAERALVLIDDPNPYILDAVRITRLYAYGKATNNELMKAKYIAFKIIQATSGLAWYNTTPKHLIVKSWANDAAAWTTCYRASAVAWAAREAISRATEDVDKARAEEMAWQKSRAIEYLTGRAE